MSGQAKEAERRISQPSIFPLKISTFPANFFHLIPSLKLLQFSSISPHTFFSFFLAILLSIWFLHYSNNHGTYASLSSLYHINSSHLHEKRRKKKTLKDLDLFNVNVCFYMHDPFPWYSFLINMPQIHVCCIKKQRILFVFMLIMINFYVIFCMIHAHCNDRWTLYFLFVVMMI